MRNQQATLTALRTIRASGLATTAWWQPTWQVA